MIHHHCPLTFRHLYSSDFVAFLVFRLALPVHWLASLVFHLVLSVHWLASLVFHLVLSVHWLASLVFRLALVVYWLVSLAFRLAVLAYQQAFRLRHPYYQCYQAYIARHNHFHSFSLGMILLHLQQLNKVPNSHH